MKPEQTFVRYVVHVPETQSPFFREVVIHDEEKAIEMYRQTLETSHAPLLVKLERITIEVLLRGGTPAPKRKK